MFTESEPTLNKTDCILGASNIGLAICSIKGCTNKSETPLDPRARRQPPLPTACRLREQQSSNHTAPRPLVAAGDSTPGVQAMEALTTDSVAAVSALSTAVMHGVTAETALPPAGALAAAAIAATEA